MVAMKKKVHFDLCFIKTDDSCVFVYKGVTLLIYFHSFLVIYQKNIFFEIPYQSIPPLKSSVAGENFIVSRKTTVLPDIIICKHNKGSQVVVTVYFHFSTFMIKELQCSWFEIYYLKKMLVEKQLKASSAVAIFEKIVLSMDFVSKRNTSHWFHFKENVNFIWRRYPWKP